MLEKKALNSESSRSATREELRITTNGSVSQGDGGMSKRHVVEVDKNKKIEAAWCIYWNMACEKHDSR